jgi:hypothetical protein
MKWHETSSYIQLRNQESTGRRQDLSRQRQTPLSAVRAAESKKRAGCVWAEKRAGSRSTNNNAPSKLKPEAFHMFS